MKSLDKLIKLANKFEYKLYSYATGIFSNDEKEKYIQIIKDLAHEIKYKKTLTPEGLLTGLNTLIHQIAGRKDITAQSKDIKIMSDKHKNEIYLYLLFIAKKIEENKISRSEIIDLIKDLIELYLIDNKYVSRQQLKNVERICESCGLIKDIHQDNKCKECYNEEIFGENTSTIENIPFGSFMFRKRP